MPVPNLPIVNKSYLNIQGIQMAWVDGTHITLSPGTARDSTNTNDIVLRSTIASGIANPNHLVVDANAPLQTINTAAKGANGLDTGTIAVSTFYAVFAIASSVYGGDPTCDNYLPAAGMLSLSATAPLLPSGYDMFRRVGWVLTSGAGAVLQFTQSGTGLTRPMWYSAAIVVLAATAQAAFTAQSLAVAVPPQISDVSFQATLIPNVAGENVALRATGSASAAGYVIMSGDVAAVSHIDTIVCQCNATPSIDWKTDAASTVALKVSMYNDYL